MFDWVLGNKGKKKAGKRPAYDEAKEIAAEGGVAERQALAAHDDLYPELLYFFAADEAPQVRREVAQNKGTPLQADQILSTDQDAEVRCELARKIGRLVPSFSGKEQERLIEMAIGVLETLARDQLPQVRAIISEEIKSASNVPEHIVLKLARDVEAIVSAPVLEYSPLLSAQDLLMIIAGGVSKEALCALSRRDGLMENVTNAIVKTRDVQATGILLENKTAAINEKTMNAVASVAVSAVELHKPMVNRENLPLGVIRRIAGFVSSSLVEILIQRSGLDEDMASGLRQAARRRIDAGDFAEKAPGQSAGERAAEMFAQGKLDEKGIVKAIADKDVVFIHHALALMSGIKSKTVKEMLDSGSGKAVTALAWKAGLSMKAALALQTKIARIQPRSMIKAEDGDYPLTEDELAWFINYFVT
ncbi:MAG: hypothetical protein A3G18_12135 [Rhodospirillales bacterium RIFCSPLOWO2_12_FULL_58_28]|nr:MAG: hypothetical protein A3H92_12150 [Rhodospirillales bacterium RIFCSPLOWO2_02_FULL_58_16]OHC79614.1 MAG: hypothetical protein A3G18_12135 [Rhodospirillales bacterium RIFCSPLOWO2_12_FULL_58_28]